jgi:hypothetical protein
MYNLVPIGWPLTLSRTPKALTYGTWPRCHTPTIAPGIDAWRITRSIAALKAAALGRRFAIAGAASAARTKATSAPAATTRQRPE